MTEQEIIKYWKDNATEMRAFAYANHECQEWLRKCKHVSQLTNTGGWSDKGVIGGNLRCEIYSIPFDYSDETKGRWVFKEIKNGYYVVDGTSYSWNGGTLFTNPKYLFGGWEYHWNGNTIISVNKKGVNEHNVMDNRARNWKFPLVPVGIRIWVKE